MYMSLYVCVYIGQGQESSTSIVDLDIEPGSETECRDRGLGGTLEDNTEECFMETPMMSAANQTGDSSCPLWLRKVCYPESTMEQENLSLNHKTETCEWRLTVF